MTIGKLLDDHVNTIEAQKAQMQESEHQIEGSIQFQAEGQTARYVDNNFDAESGMFRYLIAMDETLPRWWSRERDIFLRNYSRESGLLASTVYGESTRVKNRSWLLETQNKDESYLEYFQKVFDHAQFGAGLPSFMQRYAVQYLTQDNGVFVELIPENPQSEYQQGKEPVYDLLPDGRRTIKQGLPAGQLELPLQGRVAGIACFDSRQCWRTYDPEWPVIYVNKWTGQWRILHWSRVAFTASHAQPDEMGRGIGLCAISRTFIYARIIQYMDVYYKEKIAGQGADFGTIAGMSQKQLENALNEGKVQQDNKGTLIYKGIQFIVGANPEVMPDVALHSVKGLPDGFDHEKEVRLAATALSVGFGISTNGLGLNFNVGRTKAESETQERETEGKGREDLENSIANIFNQRVLPDDAEFRYDEKDTRADKERAEQKQIRANTRAILITSGQVSKEEARIMAADDGDIPPEFIEKPIVGDDEVIADSPENRQDVMPQEEESEDGETEDTKKALTKNLIAVQESAFYRTLTD